MDKDSAISFLMEMFPHADFDEILRHVNSVPNYTDEQMQRLIDSLLRAPPSQKTSPSNPSVLPVQSQSSHPHSTSTKSVTGTESRRRLPAVKTPKDEDLTEIYDMVSLTPSNFDESGGLGPDRNHQKGGDHRQKGESGDLSSQLAEARRVQRQKWADTTPATSVSKAQELSRKSAEKYQSGNILRKQLTEIRMKKGNRWRETAQGRKRVWTVDDLEQKQKEDEAAIADGFGSSSRQDPSVHTFDNTFDDPGRIGKAALEHTNEFRKKEGRPPLVWHQALCDIGVGHSKDMGDGKVPFGHDGFNGRVKRYPFNARTAAENVAMSQGAPDPAKTAVDGWINSPGHRKNLLGNNKYCGIGAAKNAQGAWYLTQLFGTP